MIEVVNTGIDFSELHQCIQGYVDENIIPCCNTLILKGTDVVDVKTYGTLDRETNRPLQQDSIFRMHSSTKLVTSVAAMMLHEEGLFRLDDPLEKYLPEFSNMSVLKADAESINDVEPAADSIRINQILSHSSGLSYGFIDPESVIDKAYIEANVDAMGTGSGPETLTGLCQTISQLPLAYQPGTNWRYSFGTDVTARLIEVISNQSFDAFLQERIFDPLGMVDTGFYVPKEKQDRFTTMYASPDMMDPMAKAERPADDPYEGTFSKPKTFLSGGGGLVSTLIDYLAFTRMLINGGEWNGHRLLKPSTLDLMRTNQLAEGVGVNFTFWTIKNSTFGLGFALKEKPQEGEPNSVAGEFHWGGMAGTHIWISPNAGIAGICMTQRMPGFWHPFSHDFKRLAYQLAAD